MSRLPAKQHLPPIAQRDHADDVARLTTLLQTCPQKFAVLRLFLLGIQEKEIAAHLGIARDTVHDHFRELYGRLRVNNRVSLALIAKDALAEPPE